ncbi:MAG TPA: transglutaminase-like domain-containing protein [Gemmataceae bacterium]
MNFPIPRRTPAPARSLLLALPFAGLIFCSPPCEAAGAGQQPQGKLVLETWESALLDGKKAGHVHFEVREIEREGQTVLRATRELRLVLKRGGDVARLNTDVGTEETPEGAVTRVFMRMGLGREQQLALDGEVRGERLRVKVEGRVENEKDVPWSPEVVGLHGEQQFLKRNKAKPGDELSYLYFEPTISYVVTVRVRVGDVEEVKLPGGRAAKLLRVESKPDKIANLQLPGSTFWVDPGTYEPVVSEVDLPSLGSLRLVRTTKEAALAPVNVAELGGDLIARQSVRLGQVVRGIHDLQSVTYRVRLAKDEDPSTALPSDGRQQVTPNEDGSLDVRVVALRSPREVKDPKPAGEEYLRSNYFINSDDARVRKYAALAAGGETDPWEKAKRIEGWVHRNMRSANFSEAMATADHVARTLSGDCTEFAMLTAAMCRAAGVPARTAIGLVYADGRDGPRMAFHMWTEVYVKGQWLALDATLGRGSVGPGHLKITDHSWDEVRSFTPLLPVMRVLIARPEVRVVGAAGRPE